MILTGKILIEGIYGQFDETSFYKCRGQLLC